MAHSGDVVGESAPAAQGNPDGTSILGVGNAVASFAGLEDRDTKPSRQFRKANF